MQDFSDRVREVFSPFSSSSGTAHIAPMLYDLVRKTRPRTVVEYGSGYTTPFLAQALKENVIAFHRERNLLIDKSRVLLEEFSSGHERSRPETKRKLIADWMDAGGEASCLDPCFYVEPYVPQFLSFEALPENSTYCQKMRSLLDRLELSDNVKFVYDYLSTSGSKGLLDSMVIDLAWHDCDRYRELFAQIWPRLNPDGGMLVFHLGGRSNESEIKWMQDQRAQAGDLQLVTILEPHKLVQRGCVILRKWSASCSHQLSDFEKFSEMLDALGQIAAQPA